MQSIQTTKVQLEPQQQDALKTLFASPAWATLREVISAHCTEAQVQFLDTSMYDTESAIAKAAAARALASGYNITMDVLDGLQENSEEWYRITVETRR